MPFDIGIPELFVIFVVVLMVFGPNKIPELARGLGKTVADLRRMGSDFTREFMGEGPLPPVEPPARRMCPRCATPNPINNSFCGQCGLSFMPAQPESRTEG